MTKELVKQVGSGVDTLMLNVRYCDSKIQPIKKVRASAHIHDEHFRECVALQAQYAFKAFGKFPATVPTIFILIYLQSHHLDLEYYDTLFEPGAYLRTHAEHFAKWHTGII